MKNYNLLEGKELLVGNFVQLEWWNMPVNFSDIIIDLIIKSEEIYVYRRHKHHFIEDSFMKWLKNENGLALYNQILMNFTHYKKIDKVIPKNNEKVYNLALDKINKRKLINNFKIFIMNNVEHYSKKEAGTLTSEDLYKNNALLDQYDFIFTTGSNVIFWTHMHCFEFFIDGVYI